MPKEFADYTVEYGILEIGAVQNQAGSSVIGRATDS
jgi:hypothetical protein